MHLIICLTNFEASRLPSKFHRRLIKQTVRRTISNRENNLWLCKRPPRHSEARSLSRLGASTKTASPRSPPLTVIDVRPGGGSVVSIEVSDVLVRRTLVLHGGDPPDPLGARLRRRTARRGPERRSGYARQWIRGRRIAVVGRRRLQLDRLQRLVTAPVGRLQHRTCRPAAGGTTNCRLSGNEQRGRLQGRNYYKAFGLVWALASGCVRLRYNCLSCGRA